MTQAEARLGAASGDAEHRRPPALFRNLNAKIAALPMIAVVVVVFVGGTIWTIVYSFTNSEAAAPAALRRARSVRAPVRNRAAG